MTSEVRGAEAEVLNRKVVVAAAGTFVALNLALLRLGCDTTETTTADPRAPTSSTAPDASSRASVTLTGAVGLAGALTDPGVRCSFPVLEGLSIALLAQLPDSTSQTRIGLRSGKVTVIVSSGSGADYHERAFEGTGVRSFDPVKGAVIDSTLTEAAATAGSTKGSVGAITSIRGSVECGDQTAGTSTVTFTGATPEGTLDAAKLDPVRVECDPSPDGDEVVASGLVRVGSANALVALGLTSDGAVTVDEMLSGASHRYVADGTSSVTPDGAHVRADVVEQGGATPAHTLHVEGDLSCGLHAAG
jgi:hypothetical protein